MGKIAMAAEEVAPIDGHCGSHLLQLCWETGAQDLIINHVYAFTQLMTSTMNATKLDTALTKLADKCQLIVGLPLSAEATSFNRLVLNRTVRRPLKVRSFFQDPGWRRHDPEREQVVLETMETECADIIRCLNVPWTRRGVWHNCFGRLPGNRCCSTLEEARAKVRSSLSVVGRFAIGGLQGLAESKWSSLVQTLTKLGLGILLHNVVGEAFFTSLAVPAEVRRLEKQLAADDAGNHAADGANEVVDMQKARIVAGKNTLSCKMFFCRSVHAVYCHGIAGWKCSRGQTVQHVVRGRNVCQIVRGPPRRARRGGSASSAHVAHGHSSDLTPGDCASDLGRRVRVFASAHIGFQHERVANTRGSDLARD